MRQKSATATFLAAGAVTVLLLVSVACQSSPPMAEVQALPTHPPTWPADMPAETTSPAMPTLPVPTLSPESAVAAELDAERAVSTAKASLIVRLGVAEEAIVVKAVEAVQWSDSSLGCPRPDITYAQVITPGFRVVLEVQGRTYEYHTDAGRLVILCGAGG
jgi:hypothetical protein